MTIAKKLAAVAFAGILSSAAFAAETTNPSANNPNNTDANNPTTQQIIADASSTNIPSTEQNVGNAPQETNKTPAAKNRNRNNNNK